MEEKKTDIPVNFYIVCFGESLASRQKNTLEPGQDLFCNVFYKSRRVDFLYFKITNSLWKAI